jgi:hypothetical protein
MGGRIPGRHVRVSTFVFLLLFVICAGKSVRATDVPLSAVAPSEEALLNPCFSVSNTSVQTPDNEKHSALLIRCYGIVTYRVPPGMKSFHCTLWRADVASVVATHESPPASLNHLRVRFGINRKMVAETVLAAFTPPESNTFPVADGETLSIQLDQEYGDDAVYLMDAAFSAQSVQSVSSNHVLTSGAGYANLGAGARQVAFHDFHAGESVPLRVEFAGEAARAEVGMKITSLSSSEGGHVISIPVNLQSTANKSDGEVEWTVPSTLGPATLELQVSVGGKQVYFQSERIAISKLVDIAAINTSTFGVHISTSGMPFLQDDFANLWGAKWARVFLRWEQIEAQQDTYDWSRIDYLIDLYRQQHMFILGVMGEVPPKWVVNPATQMPPAYERFVIAALEHFRGKIQYWDVYNEIDSKYYGGIGFDRQSDPQGDINVLRQEMENIHRFDSSLVRVCCSTGGTSWLQYDKRLFDAGMLSLINAVSMHPYQAGPPENSDNGLNYVEMVGRLEGLVSTFGSQKPVWSTEANWLIGPAGTRGVTAPDVTEHEQSEYAVRVNLLSLGLNVPYFLHSPFYTSFHRDVLVDSLSSYAAMASILSDAKNAKLLQLPDGLYGVSASTRAGTVVALWSNLSRPISVHVAGLSHMTIQDMYGNAITATSDPAVSGAPIYVTGQGVPDVTAPHVSVSAGALPDPRRWTATAGSHVESTSGGIHVTSSVAKYDMQVASPIFAVSANSCYLIRADLVVHHGGVGMTITDPDTHKNLTVQFMYAVTGNDRYSPVIRVETKDDTRLQVRIQAANPTNPDISDFHFSGSQISRCP